MKPKIWMKKLLGIGLAAGLLVSLVSCGQPADQAEASGTSITGEATEESKTAMGTVVDVKVPDSQNPGKAAKPDETQPQVTQPSEGTEPTENQPKETQPAESKPTEPKATEPKATEPRETEPKATEPRETEHSHNYTAAVTAPTCENQGYTTYTCACGDSCTDSYTSALGHSFGDWVTTQEPTTEAEGQQVRTCTRCGTTETRSVEKLPEQEPGVTEADIPTLEAYARSYAESVGFVIDTSMHKGNSGYYPAGHMRTSSIEAAKEDIREKIDTLKTNLIASDGNDEGFTSDARYRFNCIIEPGASLFGGYGIFALYG